MRGKEGVMMEIRRILCPTDLSEPSRHALDHAVALAHFSRATVSLLYVHPTVTVTAYAPGIPLLPGATLTPPDEQAVLQSLRDFAGEASGTAVSFEYVLRHGDAAREITEEATQSDAGLIVLGTHGRSGFEHLVMGSVAEKVLRKARCPVMTVPPRVGDLVPLPTTLFGRVLCAIDFSDSSIRALEHATSIAQEAGGQLVVMHVLELLPEDVGLDTSWATQRTVADYFNIARADRQARLDAAVPSAVRERCEVHTVMATGRAYREILREAAERRSDLIVLGVHGRNPLDLLLFGSTTHEVFRRASCPVLTVRTNG